jgi:hypothetical protein
MRNGMKEHNNHLYSLLGLAVLASLLGGCSPGSKLACPEPDEEIANPSPGEERVGFTLQNNTCMSICVLLVSPDHCEYMGGVNWVKDHPLHSGESVTKNIPPGKYAAWVEYCTEEYRADENLKVYSDYVHAFINPALGNNLPCETSLNIVNNSAVPICEIRIGITESVYTGWNWIGAEHIQPGESLVITLRPDTYFIRAMDCDGTWLRSEVDVPVSGHQTWTVP